MRVLDLFSAAAGGWSLGLHRAGFRTVAACEFVDWRRALYAENNPDVRLYDDVRTLTADQLFRDLGYLPDVVVGSPPCQDISPANAKGKGVEGLRSGLYFDAIRLVDECRPRWFAFENSANLRSRGADAVLGALEALGYACWPVVVRARDIGANHERPRSWLIGCDADEVARHPLASLRAGADSVDARSAHADADGDGRPAGRRGRRRGIDLSVPDDRDREGSRGEILGHADAEGFGHEGGRPRRHGSDGDGSPPTEASGGDDADAAQIGRASRTGYHEGLDARLDRREPDNGDGDGSARDASNADEARQADGCLVAGLRSTEIADDGCGHVGRDDVSDADGEGQSYGAGHAEMGGGAGAGDVAVEPWADWNGGLAGHLRVDDGLSAWVAGTRIALGRGKGTSAASLIVEAFGDAVVPQIPEAIGRAILRVEAALGALRADAVA